MFLATSCSKSMSEAVEDTIFLGTPNWSHFKNPTKNLNRNILEHVRLNQGLLVSFLHKWIVYLTSLFFTLYWIHNFHCIFCRNTDSDLHLTVHFITGVTWKPFQSGRGIQITRATDLGQLRPVGMPGRGRGKHETETASMKEEHTLGDSWKEKTAGPNPSSHWWQKQEIFGGYKRRSSSNPKSHWKTLNSKGPLFKVTKVGKDLHSYLFTYLVIISMCSLC